MIFREKPLRLQRFFTDATVMLPVRRLYCRCDGCAADATVMLPMRRLYCPCDGCTADVVGQAACS